MSRNKAEHPVYPNPAGSRKTRNAKRSIVKVPEQKGPGQLQVRKTTPVAVILGHWYGGLIGYRFTGSHFVKADARQGIWRSVEPTQQEMHKLITRALRALPRTLSNKKLPRKAWLRATPHPVDPTNPNVVNSLLPPISIKTNIDGLREAAELLLITPTLRDPSAQKARKELMRFDIRWQRVTDRAIGRVPNEEQATKLIQVERKRVGV